MGGSAAETIRQPRDRLRGQPQEREHSDAAGGTRDRLPPARGSISARGIVTEWPRPGIPTSGSAGLGERQRIEPGPALAGRALLEGSLPAATNHRKFDDNKFG
jgi:hypothetical protein